jgi:hypothetical protein
MSITKSKSDIKLFPTVFLVSFFLLFACSKKADNDEEIRKMIVGTWKTKTNGGTLGGPSTYHIMEFAHDGKYRELKYRGFKDMWNSADTIGIGSLYHIITWELSFQDSVFYDIYESKIFYKDNLSSLASQFGPSDRKIIWIKPKKMKIEGRHENYVYEKI